jgi:hypothetical protein
MTRFTLSWAAVPCILAAFASGFGMGRVTSPKVVRVSFEHHVDVSLTRLEVKKLKPILPDVFPYALGEVGSAGFERKALELQVNPKALRSAALIAVKDGQ